ncbi:MAG: DUF362 domain-containing protein [Gemmatimonadota bacterium]|nr:MAG: DUF362 domain-containing protein [Gemmatimonadota bacterium]
MRFQRKCLKIFERWYWLVGPVAFLWVLLRSATNPKRLTYPCQRAAMPLAANWALAAIALLTGSMVLRKFAKLSAAAVLIAGTIWFIGGMPDFGTSGIHEIPSLPVWDVVDPLSRVFVMDAVPPTTGSLAAGDASVPDAYLSDPAIDTLVAMLEAGGVFLHQTASHPEGIVGVDNVVVIKGNFQWTSRNTTSTDRIKGLVWQILNHPDGFSGEILVCDNTQDLGTGINHNDNNSEDPDQSIVDVVNTFYSKGYPLYLLDWVSIWDDVASEYSDGDYDDGYVYESETMVSYPKFRSPSGNHYISLRHGIWDSLSGEYDASRLCIIDFPVLKAHFRGGSTIAVKNWIGVLTTAYREERYGGIDPLHDDLFFGPYALVARVMAVTFPRLSIVDAAWTTRQGPINLSLVENTRMLLASTDPVAVSWYAAKFILTPIAVNPFETDPDRPGGLYNTILDRWTTFLADSAGFACTNTSSRIAVCDRTILGSPYIWLNDYTVDDSQGNNNGRPDEGETVSLVATLTNMNLDATGISVTLTTDDPDVQIIDPTVEFGGLAKDESITNEGNPFSFSIDTATVAHLCQFQLNIAADGGYTKSFDIELIVGTPTILLVDDDAGVQYEQNYTLALRTTQIFPEEWDASLMGTPTAEILQQYETVIWFTGDDRISTLTSEEQSAIRTLLDGGGKLLIAGQNIGYDLVEDGTISDADFYANYLHADYLSDSAQETFLYGIAGDPISGEYQFLPIGENQTSPDAIAPREGASPVFLYQVSREAAAIKYDGDHKVVYFGLGLEGIRPLSGDEYEVRGTIMGKIIQWLGYVETRGDVTQDGAIDILDVLTSVNMILGTVQPTPTQEWAADCNSDGTVDILDVLGIVNVILGIGTCPPEGTVGISPTALKYIQSLESLLTPENFSTLMTLIKEVYAPQKYRLAQNYPNPFNPSTDIRYQIPDGRDPVRTTLKIYNILGQEVKVLVDEVQEPGHHAVTWDASDVSSGVYFYRLSVNDGQWSETKRMVLMK